MSSIFLGEPPANIKQWIIEHYTPPTPAAGPLCFTAEQANSTVRFDSMAEGAPIAQFYPDMNLQYSTDGSNWTVMDLTQPPSDFTLANVGDKIYFKAVTENPDGFSNNGPACQWKMTGKIAASGNIQYLLKSDGSRTDVPSGCYSNMFNNCTSLTSAPQLSVTTLADRCYTDMFSGCTSLTSAPELPSTTLADQCYSTMFSHCTSLASAPALPATTLASNCYYCMFVGCTSLASAPALPATTLVDRCYTGMFSGCTSLASAPELPATTLAGGCYDSIFYNCTKFSECHMKTSMEGVYNTSTHGDTTKTVIYDL